MLGGQVAGAFHDLMRGSKDGVLAFGLRKLLNSRLGAIGTVTDLRLDTSRRRARIEMALRGERGAIDVADVAYDIRHVDGSDWLTLVDATASREWVAAALKQFAVGRSFHLPAAAARALRLLA